MLGGYRDPRTSIIAVGLAEELHNLGRNKSLHLKDLLERKGYVQCGDRGRATTVLRDWSGDIQGRKQTSWTILNKLKRIQALGNAAAKVDLIEKDRCENNLKLLLDIDDNEVQNLLSLNKEEHWERINDLMEMQNIYYRVKMKGPSDLWVFTTESGNIDRQEYLVKRTQKTHYNSCNRNSEYFNRSLHPNTPRSIIHARLSDIYDFYSQQAEILRYYQEMEKNLLSMLGVNGNVGGPNPNLLDSGEDSES